nr:MAG TPA: hypothetical protein [Caudoviricetes sp.]
MSIRTIKGRKFLKQVDDTLKCGNRIPVLFPGEPEPVDIIQWQVHPSDNIRKDIGIILDTLNLHRDLKTTSYFVSGKPMMFIDGYQSHTGGFDEYTFRDGDEWLYFHSTKNTSLTTKKGLNSTQLHLNHVRRIQVD